MSYGVIIYNRTANEGEDEIALPREALTSALLAVGATAREQGWYYITRQQGFVKVELPAAELRYITLECPNVTRASFALAAEVISALAATVPNLELAVPGSGRTLLLDASSASAIADFLMADWRSSLSCTIVSLRRE